MLAESNYHHEIKKMLMDAGGDPDGASECYNPSEYAPEGTYDHLKGVLPTCYEHIMDMLFGSFEKPPPIKVDIVGYDTKYPDSVSDIHIHTSPGSMPPYYVMDSLDPSGESSENEPPPCDYTPPK
jgi:hypothetical protein